MWPTGAVPDCTQAWRICADWPRRDCSECVELLPSLSSWPGWVMSSTCCGFCCVCSVSPVARGRLVSTAILYYKSIRSSDCVSHLKSSSQLARLGTARIAEHLGVVQWVACSPGESKGLPPTHGSSPTPPPSFSEQLHSFSEQLHSFSEQLAASGWDTLQPPNNSKIHRHEKHWSEGSNCFGRISISQPKPP